MPKDEKISKRIVDHMNNDHAHNLEDFLVISAHIDPLVASRKPTMESIDLSSMTISYIDMQGTKCHSRIPFEPSIESYGLVRERLVEMAQKAAAKRGFSEYLISDIPVPNTIREFVVIILFFSMYFGALKPDYLHWFIYDVLKLTGEIPDYIVNYNTSVFRVIIAVHLFEAMIILFPLTRTYRIPTHKKIVCMLLCFVEGIFFLSAFKLAVDRAQNPNRKKLN